MKNEEMELQSREIDQQIFALINCLNDYKKSASPEFNNLLLQVEKDFKNCQRKLNAKKYFVACFGALKAGKSTLMNALAEREVSPSGAGETTLHCSIILSADDNHPEGITLYRSKKNDGNKETNRQKVEKLFSFFQDGITEDEIKEDFEYKFYSFTKLEYILTVRQPVELQNFQDFMIAEIRINIDDNSILKKDVALIDMPGIDGAIAGGEKNHLLKYVTDNCQHLLWVQSSMSAINDLTLKRVTGFSNDKPSTPIFSICNIVKAKTEWLTPDAEDADLKETYNKIASGCKLKGCISEFKINAAMAWAACNYDKEKDKFKVSNEYLLEKSHIKDLKENLTERVDEAKTKTIVCDALDKIVNVENSLNEDNHGINQHLEEQQVAIKNAQEAIFKYQKDLKEKLEKINNDVPGESIEDKARRAGLCKKMEIRFWNEDTADMGLLKELNNKEIKVVLMETGNLNKDIQKEVVDKAVYGLNAEIKRYLSKFNNNLLDFAEKDLKDRGEKLKLENIGQLESYDFRNCVIKKTENITLPDVKQWIEQEKIEVYKVSSSKSVNWRLFGKRNKSELDNHVGELKKGYIDYLKFFISAYFDKFAIAMDEVYRDFCRDRKECLRKIVSSKVEESNKRLEQAEKTKSAIEKIKEEWRIIRDNAEKLKQEING